MTRSAIGWGLLALAACGALAQSPAALSFEVTSIRTSQGGRPEGGRRENIHLSPDGVTMRNVSLRSCIRWAYHVMDVQVSGPDWMSSVRFDIEAKAAGAVPEDAVRAMTQSLLADRFKVALHRQSKEFTAYVLEVAKGGPKFTESSSEGESSVEPDRRDGPPTRITVRHMSASLFVEQLSNLLRAPVINETGLTGSYDLTIDVAKYISDISGALGDGGGGAAAGPRPPFDPVSIAMAVLPAEFGLKLESRKMPMDLLIVDHAEKTPTEN